MKIYSSEEVNDGFPDLSSDRKEKAHTKDGKIWCVKAARCRKCKCKDRVNPTYVVNEVVYGFYAKAAGLRIPDFCLIKHGGQTYFGSEWKEGRKEVNGGCQEEVQSLSQLSVQQANFPQVVRCLLLDVALLNSDRHANNFLIENGSLVWFFDHDGALWGDGYPAEMKGDLWRLSLELIKALPPEKWFYDYLKSGSLNRKVWHDERIVDEVRRALELLPLDERYLSWAKAEMPPAWLSVERMQATMVFLSEWWSILRAFLQRPDAIDKIRRAVDRIEAE